VTPDETGWRVGGRLWWIRAFSSSQVTVYAIQPWRGFEQSAEVLGADFKGFLAQDGWSIYRQFVRGASAAALPRNDPAVQSGSVPTACSSVAAFAPKPAVGESSVTRAQGSVHLPPIRRRHPPRQRPDMDHRSALTHQLRPCVHRRPQGFQRRKRAAGNYPILQNSNRASRSEQRSRS